MDPTQENIPPKVSLGGTLMFLAMMMGCWFLGFDYNNRFDETKVTANRNSSIEQIDIQSSDDALKEDPDVADLMRQNDTGEFRQ